MKDKKKEFKWPVICKRGDVGLGCNYAGRDVPSGASLGLAGGRFCAAFGEDKLKCDKYLGDETRLASNQQNPE